MPANINYANGRYSAMYADVPAWHSLGETAAGAATPEEAIERAGTGFIVDVAPSGALIDGEWVVDPDGFKTYRTDTKAILGSVGKDYKPIQNITPMQLLAEVVRTDQAGIVAHAALGKGERLFAVLDLKRLTDMKVKGDPSRHGNYLVAQWWHDGTGAMTIGPSSLRTECQNMANAQLSSAEARGLLVRVEHRGDHGSIVEKARNILGYAEERMLRFYEFMNVLADIPTPEGPWLDGFLERLVPIEAEMVRPQGRLRTRATIADLYRESKTLVGVPDSLYRVHQSVTEFADHYRPVRGEGRAAAERRMGSVIDGPVARLKLSSIDLLRQEFELAVPAR